MDQEWIHELAKNAYNYHVGTMWKSQHLEFKILTIFSTFSFSRLLRNKCKKEPKIYEKYQTEKKIKNTKKRKDYKKILKIGKNVLRIKY